MTTTTAPRIVEKVVPCRVIHRGDVIRFDDPDGIQSHGPARVAWVDHKIAGNVDIGLEDTWLDRQGDPTCVLHLIAEHDVVLYELEVRTGGVMA